MASQVGENSQTYEREHTIVSSILTDLIFRRSHEWRAVVSEPSLNRRRSWDRATRFKTQNQHNKNIKNNINLDLGFSEIKEKIVAPNPLNPSIKFFAESQWFELHQIGIWKAHDQNCLQIDLTMIRTIPFNSETSLRIRSRENTELPSNER